MISRLFTGSSLHSRCFRARAAGFDNLRYVVVLALLSFVIAPPISAQQSLLPAPPPVILQEAPRVTQREALDIARARYPGTVISINEVQSRNSPMRYRIRMDNEGNIFTVFVNSVTGAVSRE